MKRSTREALPFIIVALMAAAFFFWPSIVRFIAHKGLEQARQSGANISWNGITSGPLSVGLESLTVWMRGPRVKGAFAIPISLELQNLSVDLKLRSLLALSPTVTYRTELYGGTIRGDAKRVSGATRLNANLLDVEIGSHPQLLSLGIKGGATSGTLQEMTIISEGVNGGTFSLKVRKLELPAVEAIRPLLKTDTLGTVDLDAEGTASPSAVTVKSIRLSSLLGSIVGSFTASEHLSHSPTLKGSFEVSLSERGIESLGPWLPLIPGAQLPPSTAAFTLTVASTPCSSSSAVSTVIRTSSGCVKLVFNKR
ncbi:MAG: hypothetical protein RIS36_2393 [Pseudomonadota bacterium]|jgi:hypothetical protein